MLSRIFLLALFFSGATAYVYTCHELKNTLVPDAVHINATQVCVVVPEAVKFPYNDWPYTDYLYETYLIDTGDGDAEHDLPSVIETRESCITGVGPWLVKADNVDNIKCSSNKFPHAEIILTFSSEEESIIKASPNAFPQSFTAGTYTFVAPEGALILGKKSIKDNKEATLQFFTGAGASNAEEMFPLTPEQFVADTTTIILGPVTKLVIEDDIEIELTIASFDGQNVDSHTPGYEFGIMSSGKANDLQSSRKSLISTSYGVDDGETHEYAISVTGTIRMDDDIASVITIDCVRPGNVPKTSKSITGTTDLVFNANCASIDLTYQGGLDEGSIGRSNEVIFLRVSSIDPNATPVTTEGPSGTDGSLPTDEPVTIGPTTSRTGPTRRTAPPTSSKTKATHTTTYKHVFATTPFATTPTTSTTSSTYFLLSVIMASLTAVAL